MAEHDELRLEHWCSRDLAERRQVLAEALESALGPQEGLTGVAIEVGPVGREYDLTAVAETDVGRLRTPLWSQARATIFCDVSVHPANRRQFGPDIAVREAAARLRSRLSVRYRLESRGLTVSYSPEPGVERTWVAEHSLLRKRTAVVREDRIEGAGELDVRDLLAHFYGGPSLRLTSDGGESFLLPEAIEVEGPLVTLCLECRTWNEGVETSCPGCGGDRVDTVVAARPPRR